MAKEGIPRAPAVVDRPLSGTNKMCDSDGQYTCAPPNRFLGESPGLAAGGRGGNLRMARSILHSVRHFAPIQSIGCPTSASDVFSGGPDFGDREGLLLLDGTRPSLDSS